MLAEWHLAPDYIVNNWTDELLDLMTEKLVERKERENESAPSLSGLSGQKISEAELFRRAGRLIKHEIRGKDTWQFQ